MKRGGRIMMLFGLVLGIITAVVTLFLVGTDAGTGSDDPNAVSNVELQSVVVAFQQIEPYQPIPADALGIREWPIDSVPPGAITDVAVITDVLPSTRIYPGQIVMEPMLINKTLEEQRLGVGSTAARIIPEGQVAIAISVDAIATVAGAVTDGDRVDLIAHLRGQDDQPEVTTQYVVQNVLVLKVGAWAATEDDEGGQIAGLLTLLVEPQDALTIKHITEAGTASFSLALRPINDEAPHQVNPVTPDSIRTEFNFGQ